VIVEKTEFTPLTPWPPLPSEPPTPAAPPLPTDIGYDVTVKVKPLVAAIGDLAG
jgi:hypothetical protein